MNALRELDQVAYVRFASVYREFSDVSQFIETLQGLLDTKELKGIKHHPHIAHAMHAAKR